YTPYGESNQESISSRLSTFNEACREITLSKGVSHYNVTPISQQWPEIENLIAADNLHPSGYQYQLWVESFLQEVIDNQLN
ncbi:MAG: SGNH/GDSL hydrolase family protein, partial [Flavobacteriales bacterium]